MSHHVIERVYPGTNFMACSDGVWHYTAEELGTVLNAPSPARGVLIDKARVRACGGGDNLSLVLKLEALEVGPDGLNRVGASSSHVHILISPR